MTSDGHSAAVVARTAGANGTCGSCNRQIRTTASKLRDVPTQTDKAVKLRTMPDRVSIGLQNYLPTPADLHFKVIVLFQIGNNLIQRRNYMEFIAAELVSSRDLNFGR